MDEFVSRRDTLMKAHEERILELKKKYWAEEMALEKEFDQQFNKLIKEYSPAQAKQEMGL